MRTINFPHYLLLVLLTFSSCSSDNSEDMIDEMTSNGGASFTARVNNMDFDAESDFIDANVTIQSGFYVISIAAGDPLDQNNAQAIALGMFGTDFDSLESGQQWNVIPDNQNQFMDVAVGGYAFGIATDQITDTGTTDVTQINVRLTCIDRDRRLISGEFNFVALEEETNTTFTVTNGVFTNILYEMD